MSATFFTDFFIKIMSRKSPRNDAPTTETAQPAETAAPQFVHPQNLLIGVNFIAQGDTEETRLDPGTIEAGTLPPAFEQNLRERKLLIDVL